MRIRRMRAQRRGGEEEGRESRRRHDASFSFGIDMLFILLLVLF